MQLKHLAAATSLLVAGTAAQNSSANGAPTNMFSGSDLDMINSTNSNVSLTTRRSWCNGQYTVCSTLCSANFTANDCDANALTWNCTCGKNNSAPGLEWYATSLPGELCSTLNGICMANQAMNGHDAQVNCNKTYVCSYLNISAYDKGSSGSGGSGSAATGSSASPTAAATGSGTSSGSSSKSSKGAAVALQVSENYGTAMLSGTLFAALGLFL